MIQIPKHHETKKRVNINYANYHLLKNVLYYMVGSEI